MPHVYICVRELISLCSFSPSKKFKFDMAIKGIESVSGRREYRHLRPINFTLVCIFRISFSAGTPYSDNRGYQPKLKIVHVLIEAVHISERYRSHKLFATGVKDHGRKDELIWTGFMSCFTAGLSALSTYLAHSVTSQMRDTSAVHTP